ncbi:unnamed protein product [Closterium sp. Naga37s-1]|nr:unnamed protein product [Closterium sp. Naga37s-1]
MKYLYLDGVSGGQYRRRMREELCAHASCELVPALTTRGKIVPPQYAPSVSELGAVRASEEVDLRSRLAQYQVEVYGLRRDHVIWAAAVTALGNAMGYSRDQMLAAAAYVVNTDRGAYRSIEPGASPSSPPLLSGERTGEPLPAEHGGSQSWIPGGPKTPNNGDGEVAPGVRAPTAVLLDMPAAKRGEKRPRVEGGNAAAEGTTAADGGGGNGGSSQYTGVQREKKRGTWSAKILVREPAKARRTQMRRATPKAVAPRAPALPLPPSMRALCCSSCAPCFVAARALVSPSCARPRVRPALCPRALCPPLVAPAPPHVAALLVAALPLASASSPPAALSPSSIRPPTPPPPPPPSPPSSFPLSFVLQAPPYFFLLLFPLLLYYPSTPSAPSPSSSCPLSIQSPPHLTLSSASLLSSTSAAGCRLCFVILLIKTYPSSPSAPSPSSSSLLSLHSPLHRTLSSASLLSSTAAAGCRLCFVILLIKTYPSSPSTPSPSSSSLLSLHSPPHLILSSASLLSSTAIAGCQPCFCDHAIPR